MAEITDEDRERAAAGAVLGADAGGQSDDDIFCAAYGGVSGAGDRADGAGAEPDG